MTVVYHKLLAQICHQRFDLHVVANVPEFPTGIAGPVHVQESVRWSKSIAVVGVEAKCLAQILQQSVSLLQNITLAALLPNDFLRRPIPEGMWSWYIKQTTAPLPLPENLG